MWGHLHPLGRLANVLGSQGHELHAWVPPRYAAELGRSGATIHPHEPVEVRRSEFDIYELAVALAEETEGCLATVIEAIDDEQVDLVIHDVHAPWARVAADYLGIPRIVTTPLFPPPADATPPDAVPWFPEAASLRLATAADAIHARWGVDLGDWASVVWNGGETTLNFSTEEITGRPSARAGGLPASRAGELAWHYVGPLLDPAPARAPRRERPFVYASFGTFYQVELGTLAAAVSAFANEPVDVLISTGRTAVAPADLGPLADNVVATEFAPGRATLARADLFVTHGGCSSVHEALLAGVPMVCVPQGADQFDWSRRMGELGAGVVVGTSATAISDAAQEVLGDQRYARRAAALGERLARFDGGARVADVVNDRLRAELA
jgi:UDP:flavonoid glycosyltransferase YjiC (YdhE family)